MTIETATYISDLNVALPAVGDDVSEGDNHITLIKTTVKATFPNVAGAVTPTHTELNYVDGVTSAIQTQLDAKAALTDLSYITQNSKSADFTYTLAEAGEFLLHPSADTTPRTFTIPANASVAYPVGTILGGINQHGAGAITLAITSDTMRLLGPGTTGSRTIAADGQWVAKKITTTEWVVSGINIS